MSGATTPGGIPIICRVQALYPFKSNDPSSLSFNQDDQIDVLNKLPSGWWDGLCNDTRGWFPSNYVKVIDEDVGGGSSNRRHSQQSDILEPQPPQPRDFDESNNNRRKTEYRLSLAFTGNNNHSQPSKDWIVQRTEDGNGYYYYNPITGEIKFNHEDIMDGHSPAPSIITRSTTRTTSTSRTGTTISTNGHDDHDHLDLDYEQELEELTTLNSSIVMMDSESDSEYRSIIDVPWSASEASTFNTSITDEKPQWIQHRVTTNSYFSTPTSTSSSGVTSNTNHHHHHDNSLLQTQQPQPQPPQLLPRSPSRKPSVRKLDNSNNSNEPLSWNRLSSNIAIAIHQLTTAAKNGTPSLYYPCSIAIVNSIRYMLVSSCTIDKDSIHIKTNSSLRSHHRSMMASMSKLTLSAQTGSDSTKILTESSDLLIQVRNFVNTCQDLNMQLIHTDPQWIIEDNQQYQYQLRRPSTNSSSTGGQRYSLQINLAENLETMGTCIQDSAETIIKCIASFGAQADRASLAALLFTHFRNLSNQTGLFLGYLDETDFSPVQDEVVEMKDLLFGKQALADSLGLLFFKMQALTNEEGRAFDYSLRETEEAAASLFDPIELICSTVLSLANKNRSRANSNASSFLLPQDGVISKPAANGSSILNESIITEEEEPLEEFDEIDNILAEIDRNGGDFSGEDEEGFDEDESIIDGNAIMPKRRSKRNTLLAMDRHRSEITVGASAIPPPMVRSHTAPPTKQTTSSNKLKKFFGDDAPLPPAALGASGDNTAKGSTSKQVTERPDFLNHDYDANDIVYNMEGNVKGGTLPALVERLTMHDYLDMNFINTFLLTYRSFCSSEQLLDLLEARYNMQCPQGLTDEEAIIWEEKKLKLVRLRVFNVLKNWLELYYNEDDSKLLDRLLEFTHTHIKVTLKFSNGQLESLIQKRKNHSNKNDNTGGAQGGLKKMILTLPDPPEPILPKNRRRFKLLDIDTLEMARQLTIMDFKLYSAIQPIECLDKAWSQEDDNVANNIRASIEYCNQITSWVSDVILSQHDIKKRSVLIKYWVQVAEKCRILNNFNTCMAILSAFDNSSVGRLKRTWEVVGARTTQILQQIRKLMGANRNFADYRAIIHSINPPCIPFLGIYLQDLTFIEDGNANELKKNSNLINFAKRAKAAEVIREIQQYQSSLYQLKPVDDLQEFIRSNLKSTRDEEQLYNESLKLEPREREDEKITRLLQESGFL